MAGWPHFDFQDVYQQSPDIYAYNIIKHPLYCKGSSYYFQRSVHGEFKTH